jgi:hypothetical protein
LTCASPSKNYIASSGTLCRSTSTISAEHHIADTRSLSSTVNPLNAGVLPNPMLQVALRDRSNRRRRYGLEWLVVRDQRELGVVRYRTRRRFARALAAEHDIADARSRGRVSCALTTESNITDARPF